MTDDDDNAQDSSARIGKRDTKGHQKEPLQGAILTRTKNAKRGRICSTLPSACTVLSVPTEHSIILLHVPRYRNQSYSRVRNPACPTTALVNNTKIRICLLHLKRQAAETRTVIKESSSSLLMPVKGPKIKSSTLFSASSRVPVAPQYAWNDTVMIA